MLVVVIFDLPHRPLSAHTLCSWAVIRFVNVPDFALIRLSIHKVL